MHNFDDMKIKLLIFFIVSLSAVFNANAQTHIEPYLGLTVPTRDIGGSDVVETAGINTGIEVRKKIPSSPFSIGVDLFVSSAVRQMKAIEGRYADNSQRIAGVAGVCDYNINLAKQISFFAGTNIGLAQRHTIKSGIDKEIGLCPEYGFLISPRVGIELWNHFRITLEARFTQRDYNVAAFRLGYSFGRTK